MASDPHSDPGSDAPSAPARWHALSADAVLGEVGSTLCGLPADEARRRLARHGPNELERTPPEPAWRILVRQFRSLVVLLLVVAAVLALFTGDPLDAAAIAVVLLLNTALGFASEWRARRAMEALLSLQAGTARVRRPGSGDCADGSSFGVTEVAAAELVPGDVVEVGEGEAVPADLRLIEATELTVVEAPLTGESVPVTKRAAERLPDDAPLPDRVTMAWLGTNVAGGRGVGVVVATGARTQVGRIGVLVRAIPEERTPLERRLDTLGRRLVGAALGVAALVGWLGWLRGWSPGEMLQTALALAVAAVPEGLPAVATITLAVGLNRMARRNALVRRLPAVEALGSATVVCTDKTGTLTRGRMELVRTEPADPGAAFWRAALLGTHAHVAFDDDGAWQADGDPTEAALVAGAIGAGNDRAELERTHPTWAEVPFSSTRRYAASLHGGWAATGEGGEETSVPGDGGLAVLRGAPEVVLAHCELSDDERARWNAVNHAMAADGLRVLALAERAVARAAVPAGGEGEGAGWIAPESGWRWLGLAGLSDPPAEGVADTIAAFHGAGIETVMITGDQADTGRAIARALGMDEGRVHARVGPEEKLALVSDLQAKGEVAAMLGDGVNDAAALRKADVGVAMGRRGTGVAREVADVILLDDRFPTLAEAVREGRVIHDNIRKFVFYLFSCNLSEILVLLVVALAGAPLPLLPLQILWLNLLTDTLPALALAFEPPAPDVMQRPPRPREAQLVTRAGARSMVFYALLITGATLVAFLHHGSAGLHDPARARTLAFSTLALAQLFHLGNARGMGRAMWRPADFVSNPWALAAAALGLALQVIAVHVPLLQSVLGTVPLTPGDWGWVIACALVPTVVGQLLRSVRGGSPGPRPR